MTPPPPPKELTARAKRLWRAVVSEYELSPAELAHPATDIELRHRTLFARLVAQLGVKVEEDAGAGRVARRGPRRPPARLRSIG